MIFNLSYIYVTKNKYEYVKITLPNLINQKKADEEIIVVDGNSTDGTKNYLINLKNEGYIDILISENDMNESHALNKGILSANGDIIKVISDDDIFFYDSINRCKDFMLMNNDVEVLFGSTFDVHHKRIESLRFLKSSLDDFLLYRDLKIPFAFCGLSLMFRKSIISKFGLFSTLTFAPDTEFSLRITKLKANITYFNDPLCIRIENPSSNFSFETAYKFEYEGAFLLYALKIISNSSFVFFNLKFYSKSLIRRFILRNGKKANKFNAEIVVDKIFYTKVTEEVTKKFTCNNPNSELFIRSK
jgi:glycosyltransferase involved in cell wall biosynthesis